MPETAEALLYEAHPFTPTPERAEILSYIMDQVVDFDILFPDYLQRCPEEHACGDCMFCLNRKASLAAYMNQPGARFWEIWASDNERPIGLIYFTNIQPGLDAVAHYLFFDGKLSDKTPILEAILEWAFTDHEDWDALERLTLEIPEHYYALARHASRKLGFGGPFRYKTKGFSIPVEGVRKNAYHRDGTLWDTMLLGKIREAA